VPNRPPVGSSRKRRRDAVEHVQNDIDAALAALTADELRALVREVLLELYEPIHSRVADALVKRAARSASCWTPAAVGDAGVADVVAFAEGAARVGAARPEDMDERLRRGSAAFLRRDYATAHRILSALLRPIANGEIDLGEREMVDEVLGVDLQECMAQYVVAAYMISAADRRAEAVRSAIAATCGVALLWWPISEMERAAVEPLPALDEFLRAWQAMVAEEADGDRGNQRGMDADRWLREVIERREGAAGLAKLDRRFSRLVSESARDGRLARRACCVRGSRRARHRRRPRARRLLGWGRTRSRTRVARRAKHAAFAPLARVGGGSDCA
jgi:hypothetical protein